MKSIKTTETQLRLELANYSLLDYALEFFEDVVEIWQFENGDQGIVRQIAEYRGSAAILNMPMCKWTGCCTSQIEMSIEKIISISGKLLIVSKHSANNATGYKYDSRVNIPSYFKIIELENKKIQSKIDALNKEIEALKAQLQ